MSVFSWHAPRTDVAAFERSHLSYKGALSTEGLAALDRPAPQGFNRDTMSVVVGSGADDYERARQALADWEMFAVPWITLSPPKPALELGEIAVVAVRVLGVLSVVNASRVTMLVDEVAGNSSGNSSHYGFTYATLTEHAERGEEIFIVSHDESDGTVRFTLVAHSRPARWLSWIAYPVTRWYQSRFRRDAAAAMKAAVSARRR